MKGSDPVEARPLNDWLGVRPEALVVLGSGLATLTQEMEDRRELPFHAIPELPAPSVEGHAGRFVVGRLGGRWILAQVGRLHRYEGHDSRTVGLPVRLAAAAGVRTAILTNAAGALRRRYAAGSVAVLGACLTVPPSGAPRSGGRTPLDASFDPALIEMARRAAAELGIQLPSAVYAGVLGPSYETPAEVRMLRSLSADLVGMSTVDEVAAARGAGLRVLALSVVTNPAAGTGPNRLSHADVLDGSERVAPAVGWLIRSVVRGLEGTDET